MVNEAKAAKYIYDHGCPPKYTGYQYLKDGITILLGREEEISSMRNTVYEKTADRYRTDKVNVERCLRVLIDKWWEANKCGGLLPKKPTIPELLGVCVEKIKKPSLRDGSADALFWAVSQKQGDNS